MSGVYGKINKIPQRNVHPALFLYEEVSRSTLAALGAWAAVAGGGE